MFNTIKNFLYGYIVEPFMDLLAYIIAILWWIYKLAFDKKFREKYMAIIHGIDSDLEALVDSEFES